MRTEELSRPPQHFHLALLGEPLEPTGQFTDDRIFPAPQLVEINLRLAEDDAVVGHLGGLIDHLGRMQQCLGRDTPDVEAYAAEGRPTLDERHRKPEIGSTKGCGIPAGAGAKYE